MAEKQSKSKSILGRVVNSKSLKRKSKSKGDELSDKGGSSHTRTGSVSSGGGGGQKVNTSKKQGASVSATDLRSNTVSVPKKQPQMMETSLTSSPGRQGTGASPPVRSNTLSSGGSTHSKSQSVVGPRSPANQFHHTSGENGSPLRTVSAPTNSQATASRSSHPSASDPLAAHTPTCDDPQKEYLQKQMNDLQMRLNMAEEQNDTAEKEIIQIKHKWDQTVKENIALKANMAKSEEQEEPTKDDLTQKNECAKMEGDLSHREQKLSSMVVEFDSHKEQKEKEPSQRVKDKRSSKSQEGARKHHEEKAIRERTQQIASPDEEIKNLKDSIEKQMEVEEMHKQQIQMSKNESEQLRRENERLTVEHREALRKALEEHEAKITEQKENIDLEATVANEQLEKERNEKMVLQNESDELKQRLAQLQQEKDKQDKLLEELQLKHEEAMQQQTEQKENDDREITLTAEELKKEQNERMLLQSEDDELKQRLTQLQQEKDKLLKETEGGWLKKEAQLQQKHEEAMQQQKKWQKKWHQEQMSEMAATFQTTTTKQVTTETTKLKEEHQEQVEKIQEALQTLRQENEKLLARLEEDKKKFHFEHESIMGTMKQEHEHKFSLAHHEFEQLQKTKTELEQVSKELEEQNMQLQDEKAKLQERVKAGSQEQKVALQVALEQAMENEKSRHEREFADMAVAHQQEIETKQAEIETFQKKLIEKEAQVHQLEQQNFIQSSETEREGKLQSGENGNSLLEVNQGVKLAQSPQTGRLNDLDGGPMQVAAQMSNEEKIQRLQSTISNYEKLQKDLKSKIMELEKRLQVEEEKSRRPAETMAHTPGAAVEELKQDPEVDHQEVRSMKEGKFEGANHSTESTALQEQIAELRQKLEQKNREIDEKAHAIAEKENELTEIKERLEEQETKREESQQKFELMEKTMKKTVEGTSPKASQELETYFEQLISLTQKFSELKIQSKEQEKELKNLRKIEERAKELEEGNLQAATELSQREEEMKQLHEVAIQQHTAVEPSREVKKLERKVNELQDKLEERQKEIQALKKGETPFVDPLGASLPVLSSVEDVTTLRIKVQEQQKEINNLRMQVGSVTPALREKEQLSKERERLQREQEELEKEKKILVDHTKKQSQAVLALRGQLEASQKLESMPEEQASQVKEELKKAKESALMEAQRAEQKCEKLSVEIEQLKRAAAQVQAQLQQFEKERDDSKEKYAKLQNLYEISKSQAEHVSELAKQVGKLKETATRMKSENDELKEMNELLKIEADQYKKDFDEERRDRERVVHRLGEDHDTTVGDVHTANEEYKRLREESRLKDEFLLEAQMEIDDMKKEIGEKRRLEEELKAKAAQVKQYQKQIDAMQNQLSAAQKHKVSSKSEGPQHQQEEQLEKVQIEMVQYKSKLEQVEEELCILQQGISSKDQQHQEKIDAMSSELQRLHQEKRAVEQQLETMQSRQHQLVQSSNRQLAEAQLQKEGMASQLRGQQQQQQQRREGDSAPEHFRAAYSQLVFKCQELERQLDSALDQLDGLSQQKEVLVQELHNHSIPIPYEESKANQKSDIVEPQKPISSPGSYSQQNEAKCHLPPRSDADYQQRRQQQQQEQQLQQQYRQQHNGQQAGDARSGGSGKTIPKSSELNTRASVPEAKPHLLPDKPRPPNSKQNPVEEAVVGILPPGLKIKPHSRQVDKIPPQGSSQPVHRHTSTASPANRDTTAAAAAMPAQSNTQMQSQTADNSLLVHPLNSQALAPAGPQGLAMGASHQLYQQPPNIGPQQHYGMEQSQTNMGGGGMQYNMMQIGPQQQYNRGQQEQPPHLLQNNQGYRTPPNAGSNPIPAAYNPQNAQLQPHQHPQQFHHPPLPNQQHQAQYQPTLQPPQMMHRERFQGPPNQAGLNQYTVMPPSVTTQPGRPASQSPHPGFQQLPMRAQLPRAGLPNTESSNHIPPAHHAPPFRAHQGPPPPSPAAPEPQLVQEMQGHLQLAQAPSHPIQELVCPEQPSDASAVQPAPSSEELKLPVTREYSEANSDAAGDGELLLKYLDEEIVDTAAEVNNIRSIVLPVPPDPNLHCVFCDKYFGIGEIQQYRRHMETCRGSGQ